MQVKYHTYLSTVHIDKAVSVHFAKLVLANPFLYIVVSSLFSFCCNLFARKTIIASPVIFYKFCAFLSLSVFIIGSSHASIMSLGQNEYHLSSVKFSANELNSALSAFNSDEYANSNNAAEPNTQSEKNEGVFISAVSTDSVTDSVTELVSEKKVEKVNHAVKALNTQSLSEQLTHSVSNGSSRAFYINRRYSNDQDLAAIMNESRCPNTRERFIKSQVVNQYAQDNGISLNFVLEALRMGKGRIYDDIEYIYSKKLAESKQSHPINFIQDKLKDLEGLPLSSSRLREFSLSCLDQQANACFWVAKHYDYLVGNKIINRANYMTNALSFYRRACALENTEACRLMANAYSRYGAVFLVGDYYLNETWKHLKLKTPFTMPEHFPTRSPQDEIDYVSGSTPLIKSGIRALSLDNRLKTGIRYTQEGCKLEDPNACANLGMAYILGYGVKLDSVKALDFFERACRFSLINKNEQIVSMKYNLSKGMGCYALGEIYLHGYIMSDGYEIKKDIVKGYSYFNSSCSLNNKDACFKLSLFKF